MLNTNADTIAGETAKALASLFDVTLVYCFENKGVLRDENDDDSVIPVSYTHLDVYKRQRQGEDSGIDVSPDVKAEYLFSENKTDVYKRQV